MWRGTPLGALGSRSGVWQQQLNDSSGAAGGSAAAAARDAAASGDNDADGAVDMVAALKRFWSNVIGPYFGPVDARTLNTLRFYLERGAGEAAADATAAAAMREIVDEDAEASVNANPALKGAADGNQSDDAAAATTSGTAGDAGAGTRAYAAAHDVVELVRRHRHTARIASCSTVMPSSSPDVWCEAVAGILRGATDFRPHTLFELPLPPTVVPPTVEVAQPPVVEASPLLPRFDDEPHSLTVLLSHAGRAAAVRLGVASLLGKQPPALTAASSATTAALPGRAAAAALASPKESSPLSVPTDPEPISKKTRASKAAAAAAAAVAATTAAAGGSMPARTAKRRAITSDQPNGTAVTAVVPPVTIPVVVTPVASPTREAEKTPLARVHPAAVAAPAALAEAAMPHSVLADGVQRAGYVVAEDEAKRLKEAAKVTPNFNFAWAPVGVLIPVLPPSARVAAAAVDASVAAASEVDAAASVPAAKGAAAHSASSTSAGRLTPYPLRGDAKPSVAGSDGVRARQSPHFAIDLDDDTCELTAALIDAELSFCEARDATALRVAMLLSRVVASGEATAAVDALELRLEDDVTSALLGESPLSIGGAVSSSCISKPPPFVIDDGAEFTPHILTAAASGTAPLPLGSLAYSAPPRTVDTAATVRQPRLRRGLRDAAWERVLTDTLRSMRAWADIVASLRRGMRDQPPDFARRRLADDAAAVAALPASWRIAAEGRPPPPEDDAAEATGDDAVCAVCADATALDDNPLLYCDGCDVGVHVRCYGIEVVPEGDYYCDACTHIHDVHRIVRGGAVASTRKTSGGVAPSASSGPAASTSVTGTLRARSSAERSRLLADIERVRCSICPLRGGALKRNCEGGWVHIFCAIWTPGCWITDICSMSSIYTDAIAAAAARALAVTRLDDVRTLVRREPAGVAATLLARVTTSPSNQRAALTAALRGDGDAGAPSGAVATVLAHLAAESDAQCSSSSRVCVVCRTAMGTTVRCSAPGGDCGVHFHAQCAWFAGFYMCVGVADSDGNARHPHSDAAVLYSGGGQGLDFTIRCDTHAPSPRPLQLDAGSTTRRATTTTAAQSLIRCAHRASERADVVAMRRAAMNERVAGDAAAGDPSSAAADSAAAGVDAEVVMISRSVRSHHRMKPDPVARATARIAAAEAARATARQQREAAAAVATWRPPSSAVGKGGHVAASPAHGGGVGPSSAAATTVVILPLAVGSGRTATTLVDLGRIERSELEVLPADACGVCLRPLSGSAAASGSPMSIVSPSRGAADRFIACDGCGITAHRSCYTSSAAVRARYASGLGLGLGLKPLSVPTTTPAVPSPGSATRGSPSPAAAAVGSAVSDGAASAVAAASPVHRATSEQPTTATTTRFTCEACLAVTEAEAEDGPGGDGLPSSASAAASASTGPAQALGEGAAEAVASTTTTTKPAWRRLALMRALLPSAFVRARRGSSAVAAAEAGSRAAARAPFAGAYEPSLVALCLLCNRVGAGFMRRTSNGNGWVHIFCALMQGGVTWNGTDAASDQLEAPDISRIERRRFRGPRCWLCGARRAGTDGSYGAYIPCASNGCTFGQHAMCAAREGCFHGFRAPKVGSGSEGWVFCPRHAPAGQTPKRHLWGWTPKRSVHLPPTAPPGGGQLTAGDAHDSTAVALSLRRGEFTTAGGRSVLDFPVEFQALTWLRHRCESARLLVDRVLKRERLKAALVSADEHVFEAELASATATMRGPASSNGDESDSYTNEGDASDAGAALPRVAAAYHVVLASPRPATGPNRLRFRIADIPGAERLRALASATGPRGSPAPSSTANPGDNRDRRDAADERSGGVEDFEDALCRFSAVEADCGGGDLDETDDRRFGGDWFADAIAERLQYPPNGHPLLARAAARALVLIPLDRGAAAPVATAGSANAYATLTAALPQLAPALRAAEAADAGGRTLLDARLSLVLAYVLTFDALQIKSNAVRPPNLVGAGYYAGAPPIAALSADAPAASAATGDDAKVARASTAHIAAASLMVLPPASFRAADERRAPRGYNSDAVPHPIDLSEVRRRVMGRLYTRYDAFEADVRRVVANALLAFPAGHPCAADAVSVRIALQKATSATALLGQLQATVAEKGAVPHDVAAQLATALQSGSVLVLASSVFRHSGMFVGDTGGGDSLAAAGAGMQTSVVGSKRRRSGAVGGHVAPGVGASEAAALPEGGHAEGTSRAPTVPGAAVAVGVAGALLTAAAGLHSESRVCMCECSACGSTFAIAELGVLAALPQPLPDDSQPPPVGPGGAAETWRYYPWVCATCAHAPGSGATLTGSRVWMYSPELDAWRAAAIASFVPLIGRHLVVYVDGGDWAYLDLAAQYIRFGTAVPTTRPNGVPIGTVDEP